MKSKERFEEIRKQKVRFPYTPEAIVGQTVVKKILPESDALHHFGEFFVVAF